MGFCKPSLFFSVLVSFICLSSGNENLFGITFVTSSAGDDSSGTLSAVIDTVNGNSWAGPIEIMEVVTPTLTSAPFSTIT